MGREGKPRSSSPARGLSLSHTKHSLNQGGMWHGVATAWVHKYMSSLGACLAGATGVGAASRPPLKPIRLSKHEERRGLAMGRCVCVCVCVCVRWGGDSREQSQTERQWDRCQSGGRDHPLRWQHPPSPQSY
ncbi:hypothetical protein Q5P01_006212 [Channa striata]|uniref:Uncharacterized protein n=1 Tax=Channa striata TaxID=64152 RepID=A0AA88N7P7_CHASR|nr:hypothetical protein Q5P01_006212 [Channa striata]